MKLFNYLKPGQARIAFNYHNKVLNLECSKANLNFNQKCKQSNVIPNYIQVMTKNKSIAATKAISLCKKAWLNAEINEQHKRIHTLIANLKEISKLLDSHELLPYKMRIKDESQKKINNVLKKKRKKQEIKLKKLVESQHGVNLQCKSNVQFAPRVYNLSKISLNDKDMRILNTCNSINLYKNVKPTQIFLDAETALSCVESKDKDKIRHKIVDRYNKIVNTNKKSSRDKFKNETACKKLKDKLFQSNTEIISVDKSKSIAIIESAEQKGKVKDFIQENNIYKVKKDPTANYTKIINNAIDQCTGIIQENVRYKLKYSVPVNNCNNINASTCPTFKPVIKMHKTNNPIRPLVNAIRSPTYKISKFMDNLLKSLLIVNNSFSVINSTQFAKTITGFKLADTQRMISLDIVNLYTNIPINDLKKIIEKKLNECKKVSNDEIKQIMNILSIILKQNYFSYKGEYFISSKGLAMGGPLSSTLAQIYLNHLEENFIMNSCNPLYHRIIKYFRYVDDTFMIFQGKERYVNMLLKYVNSINPNIQFTAENMINNSLNFLDLNVYLDKNKELAVKIHRKPTSTDLLIPFHSNHPRQHKYAAIRSLAQRAFSIPMNKQDLQNEIDIIHQLGFQNGFPAYIINKIINCQKNSINRQINNQQNNNNHAKAQIKRKFVPLTYFNRSSNEVGKIFEKFGYTPAFRTKFKSHNYIKNHNRPSGNKFEQAGIYKVQCSTCPAVYVGKTERNIRTRFSEHLTKSNSNIYKHITEHNHIINDLNSNVSVCHISNNRKLLSTLEKYEIRKAMLDGSHLLNIQLDLNSAGNALIDLCCNSTL